MENRILHGYIIIYMGKWRAIGNRTLVIRLYSRYVNYIRRLDLASRLAEKLSRGLVPNHVSYIVKRPSYTRVRVTNKQQHIIHHPCIMSRRRNQKSHLRGPTDGGQMFQYLSESWIKLHTQGEWPWVYCGEERCHAEMGELSMKIFLLLVTKLTQGSGRL